MTPWDMMLWSAAAVAAAGAIAVIATVFLGVIAFGYALDAVFDLSGEGF